MTAEHVAQRLNIQPRTLLRYLRTGHMVGIKIDGPGRGRWLISYDAYDAFVRQQLQNPSKPGPKLRIAS